MGAEISHAVLSKELAISTAKRLTASAYSDSASNGLLAHNHANEDEDELIPGLLGRRQRTPAAPREEPPKSQRRKRCGAYAGCTQEPCGECIASVAQPQQRQNTPHKPAPLPPHGLESSTARQSSFKSAEAIAALTGFIIECGGFATLLEGWYASQETRKSGNTAGTTDTCACA